MDPLELEALRKMLNDPKEVEKMGPWDRILYKKLLDAHEKKDSNFGKRYSKFYAPFISGMQDTKKSDLIEPNFQKNDPYDTPDESRQKHEYNKKLSNYSNLDPLLTSLSGGLGMTLAASGGIPSLVGGMALKHAGPLVWHFLKQKMANDATLKDKSARYYRDLLDQNPIK